jgi:hypothetical protein
MTGSMSADTRRLFIDYIVKTELGLNNSAWWDEQDCGPELVAYRKWARTREPTLRAELEPMSDDKLRAEYERRDRLSEHAYFWMEKDNQRERQEEIERQRQYHRSVAQKGGRAHRSAKQPPEIIQACEDMYARNPKITAKEAHRKLEDGYEMPDGRVIRFKTSIRYETFRTKYWPKRISPNDAHCTN